MLVIELPLSQQLLGRSRWGTVFGSQASPQLGGPAADTDRLAQIIISWYPDAPLGWEGRPGESDTVNLPHHLLNIRAPIENQAGEPAYQSLYALTDNDIAELLLRMGCGIPAKLANFSMSHNPTLDELEAQGVRIQRRGLRLLHATGVRDLGDANEAEAQRLITKFPDYNWGTQLGNMVDTDHAYNETFLKRRTQANVTAVRKVGLMNLNLRRNEYEPFRSLFADTIPRAAWWIEADLAVTTSVISTERPPENETIDSSMPTLLLLRYGGRPDTEAIRLDIDDQQDQFTEIKKWAGDLLEVNFSNTKEVTQAAYDILAESSVANSTMFAYKNGSLVWMRFQINPAKVAPYLPPGFSLGGTEGMITNVRWELADIFRPWNIPGIIGPARIPLHYNEIWVTAPVVHKGRHFTYPLVMLVNEEIAFTTGHDMTGCPKKFANLTYTFSDKAPTTGVDVLLNASRHGRQVVEMTAKLGRRTYVPAHGINDNEPGMGNDILWVMSQQFPWDPYVDRPMYDFQRSVHRTHEQYELTDIQVKLGAAAAEPLADWFGQVTRGGYVKMDKDWLYSMDVPEAWRFEKPSPTAWAEWWKRSFQVFFM